MSSPRTVATVYGWGTTYRIVIEDDEEFVVLCEVPESGETYKVEVREFSAVAPEGERKVLDFPAAMNLVRDKVSWEINARRPAQP